jgi:hypothetical protein
MKKSLLSLQQVIFIILVLVSGRAFSEDLNDPRFGLPTYSKQDLKAALARIPSQAKEAVEKAVPPKMLEQFEFLEGTLHGSRVILAQVTKIREEGEDRATGDSFVYFLIEVTKGRANLWKLYSWPYPKESPVVPVYGFVADPALKSAYLDFYVNENTNNRTGTRDYFRFIPGKGVSLILGCPEEKYQPSAVPEVGMKKRYFHETKSKIVPGVNGRLRVESQTEEGFKSLDPDPKKAAADSTKNVTNQVAEYRWVEVKQKYELVGGPGTQGVK